MSAESIISAIPASMVGTNGTVNERPDFFCSCGCGWITTGWPTEELARRALNNHVATSHSSKGVS